MQFKLTKLLMIKIILWTLLWILLGALAAPLMAATGDSRTSKTISFSQNTQIDKTARDAQLELAGVDTMPALITQGFRPESTVMALQMAGGSYQQSVDVSLYDADTNLISDLNNDGFYHRFSVAIDADTIYDTAYVYARLYLSYEGGPWNHYASSGAYHIHFDSEQDVFIIETELADGFAPGYYDIRIELYDADYDEWLLSYGPYDDASLSALPLEDSYYDEQYTALAYPVETEVVIAGHGHGALSGWFFSLPVLIAVTRRFVKRHK